MIFFVNVPVGLVIAVAAARLMPSASAGHCGRVDAIGAGLLFAGLVASLGPVVFGREMGWPIWLWMLLAIGVMDLIAFIAYQRWQERRCGPTLIDTRLLADIAFRRGAAATFCFFATNVSFYFVMTVYMQAGRGFTPLQTGLAFAPLALSFTVASRGAAARVARRGVSALIEGCVIELVGLALVGGAVATRQDAFAVLIVPLIVFGFGQSLVMAPLFATVLSMVPRAQAGVGAGMLATVQQAGNATGVAVIGSIYIAIQEIHSHRGALLGSLVALVLVLACAVLRLATLRRADSR